MKFTKTIITIEPTPDDMLNILDILEFSLEDGVFKDKEENIYTFDIYNCEKLNLLADNFRFKKYHCFENLFINNNKEDFYNFYIIVDETQEEVEDRVKLICELNYPDKNDSVQDFELEIDPYFREELYEMANELKECGAINKYYNE